MKFTGLMLSAQAGWSNVINYVNAYLSNEVQNLKKKILYPRWPEFLTSATPLIVKATISMFIMSNISAVGF